LITACISNYIISEVDTALLDKWLHHF